MELKSVGCGNCGAALQIPEAARFVTCNHCGSSLEIKHAENGTYSETIARIDERTGRLEQQIQELQRQTASGAGQSAAAKRLGEQLKILQLEKELSALELSWEKAQQRMLVADRSGKRHVPTKTGAWGAGAVFGGLGLILVVAGVVSPNKNAAGAIVGIVAFGVAYWAVVWGSTKANEYASSEESVGEFREREVSEVVIKGGFVGVLSPKAVRFSGDQF